MAGLLSFFFLMEKQFSKSSDAYFGAGWKELTELMKWLSYSLLDEVASIQSSRNCLQRSGFDPLHCARRCQKKKIGVVTSHLGSHSKKMTKMLPNHSIFTT